MTPEQVKELLPRRELRNFDFKASESFEGDFRVELAIAIAAMANTPGGGTILVGVAEEGSVRVPRGLTPEQLRTFDTTIVGQFLRERLDPAPEVEIADVRMPGGPVLVEVRVPEFGEVPIVVKKTLQKSGERNASAREGDLLIRTHAAQSCRVSSAEETREILGRALSKTSERLLEQIRAVVTGSAPPRVEFSPEDRHVDELPEWNRQVAELTSAWPDLARWEVRMLPDPRPPRIEPPRLRQVLQESAVSLRGWDFPAMNPSDVKFHQTQMTAAIDWDRFHERMSLGYQGAFGFARILWGDLAPETSLGYPPPPARPIDFVGLLWDLTEFLRFAVTLFEKLGAESVWLDVALHGVRGRKLGAFDLRRSLHWNTVAVDPAIRCSRLEKFGILQGEWKSLAVDWAREIFTVFQWPDANAEMLRKDQEDLLQRRF